MQNFFYPDICNDATKLAKYYKLDKRTRFQGLPLSIENDVGGVRKGVSPDGVAWETKMKAQYGYIRGTMGVDGDEIDVFIGPNKESAKVYIVHQKDPKTGKYDEDKCILGCDTKRQARELFLEHYDSKKFLGDITELSMGEFKATAARSKLRPGKITKQRARKTKPKRLPSKEWSRVFPAQRKKAEVSSHVEDFAAGMDPLGVFTNAFGGEAEKAGLSEEDHAVKQSLGTIGGFIGGATLVPSAIMGIIGGAKGAAQAHGGIGSRLSGAAQGAWEGFKMPILAPIKAAIARKRISSVMEKGTMSARDMAGIYPVIEQVRLGDLAKGSEKTEAISNVVGSIMRDVHRGETFKKAIKNNADAFSKSSTGQTNSDVSRVMTLASDILTRPFDSLIDGARLHQSAKSLKAEGGDFAIDSLMALREMAQKDEISITPAIRKALGNAHKQSGIALAEGLAGLSLGGAIGAGGAAVQYSQGRKARADFSKELRLR